MCSLKRLVAGAEVGSRKQNDTVQRFAKIRRIKHGIDKRSAHRGSPVSTSLRPVPRRSSVLQGRVLWRSHSGDCQCAEKIWIVGELRKIVRFVRSHGAQIAPTLLPKRASIAQCSMPKRLSCAPTTLPISRRCARALNQSQSEGIEYAFCLSSGGRMHFFFRKAG